MIRPNNKGIADGCHVHLLYKIQTKAFISFSVLNVITGMFVDDAMTSSSDEEGCFVVADLKEVHLFERLEDACLGLGITMENGIGLEDFASILHSHEMNDYLELLAW